jgi:hypothetical protein
MQSPRFILILLLVAGFGLSACSTPPDQELEAAQGALLAADEAEADIYLAEQFSAAEDSLAAARTEIDTQSQASALGRSYTRARALLAYVTETAGTLQTLAPEAIETTRIEADSLIAEAGRILASAESLAPKAPRATLASIQAERGSAYAALNDAMAAHSAGSYKAARDLATDAVAKASVILEQLTTGTPGPIAPRS